MRTIALTHSGKIAAFLLGMFLMAFSVSGLAQAQTRLTPTTGCPQTCPTGSTCYERSTGTAENGGAVKVCLTPSQFAAYGTQTSPAQPSGGGAGSGGSTRLTNPLQVDSIEGLLAIIINAAVYLGTIVLILALVYVGFLFVTSRGNEEKIRDARRYFFWIVIGGLLVLGARGLSEVIKSTATTLGP